MIPEKEREALMRLTMCARRDCVICKYKLQPWQECVYLITDCMHTLAEALTKDGDKDS